MVASTDGLDRIELRRRLSGLNLTALAERAGISYKRLRRFFKEGGGLTRRELALLDTVLPSEIAPVAATAPLGELPINGGAS